MIPLPVTTLVLEPRVQIFGPKTLEPPPHPLDTWLLGSATWVVLGPPTPLPQTGQHAGCQHKGVLAAEGTRQGF